MNDDLKSAIELVDDSVRERFEKAWSEIVNASVPEYRILVWGSTIQDGKDANDLDLIFEYNDSNIGPDKENSIEGYVRTSVYVQSFTEIDPVVCHYIETPDIISNSRVSRVYSIDEEGWVEFDS